jgi:hypothetical protein
LQALMAGAVALLTHGAHVHAADSSDRVEPHLHAASTQLPLNAREALTKVDGTPRQLLAARGYLRSADKLASRWSWSAQQIDAYAATDEYRNLLAEVARVQAQFKAANPGYSLYANTQTRSLDLQLQRWNESESVAAIARELHRAAIDELQASGYTQPPSTDSVHRFIEFLRNWQPPRAIPLAAPGLSLHGQSRAIDFQVMRDDTLIAGPQVATVMRVWERQGWARKLKQATADTRFTGPLQSPNEPWHYEYVPSPARARPPTEQ